MKYKYMVAGMLFSVLLLLSIGILSILFKEEEVIAIKDVNGYTRIITSLNERIASLKESDCKEAFQSMMERINQTHFTEDTTLKTYVEKYSAEDKNYIDYFDTVKSACNLKEEETDSIYVLVLASLNFPTEMQNRVSLLHEFTLQDRYSRAGMKNHEEVGSYTTKMLELQVVKELLEEVEK